MQKYLLFFLMIIPFQILAKSDSIVTKLYKNADFIAHIKLSNTPVTEMPYFCHDLGTNWYYAQFTTLEVYKRTDTSTIDGFYFVHYGYNLPQSDFIQPGKEYIVFLKRGNLIAGEEFNPKYFIENKPVTPILMKSGLILFQSDLHKYIRHLSKTTSFDRAVSKCQWKKVERKIKYQVWKASERNGSKTGNAIIQVNNWLRKHYTVDEVAEDACAIHISIYPGWSTTGVRFLTENGPKEYFLTETLGKSTNWKYWFQWAGVHPCKDKVYFKTFKEFPGYLNQIHETCKQYNFERLRGWKQQENIEIQTTIIQDTVSVLPMVDLFMRLKVVMINRSHNQINLLWPVNQNDGYKMFLFKFTEQEGRIVEEEETYLMMPHNETIGPTIVSLLPGDSLVAWHSINDSYGFSSDVTANHDLTGINEGTWLLSVIYKPYMDGDSSRYWNPKGGYREVYNNTKIQVINHEPSNQTTLKVEMLERYGYYTNNYGQKCVYNGLVKVLETPEGSDFKVGDTIAYRFPFNMKEYYYQNEPRPALNADLAQPGDVLLIDVNISFPYDEFSLPKSGKCRNVLLMNFANSVRPF